MKRDYIIYGLVDPFTQDLRYIGQSVKGVIRGRDHCRPSILAKKENPHNAAWIKSVMVKGQKPEVVVLERFESAEKLDEAEMEWIAEARRVGCKLNNVTDGGNKPPIRIMSLEERQKRSEEMTGKPGYWKGKKRSEEFKAIVSKTMTGVSKPQRTEEHKRNASKAQGGRPFRDENGNLYYTQMEAARILKVSREGVRSALNGTVKTIKGHKLTYIMEN